jgi:uncharacterized membrane protein YkvA (DUF1232 family)
LFGVPEVLEYLQQHARAIAPADVSDLLARARMIRRKAQRDTPRHPRSLRQVEVALRLLNDHTRDACPQVPYVTVAVLAAALFYWTNPVDAIPDFTGPGTSDDALMLSVAFQLVAPGVERYCTFHGIPIRDVLDQPRRSRTRR